MVVPECSEAFKVARCCNRADGERNPISTGSTCWVHGTRIVLHLDVVRALGQEVLYCGCVAVLRCLKDIWTLGYVYIHAHDLRPDTLTITWDIRTQANSWILDSQVTTCHKSNQGCGIRWLQPRSDFQNMSQPKKPIFPRLHFCDLKITQQSPAWEQMSLRILDAMATVSELWDWEFIASCKACCTPSWQLRKQSETWSIVISPSFCHPILNIENPFRWQIFPPP